MRLATYVALAATAAAFAWPHAARSQQPQPAGEAKIRQQREELERIRREREELQRNMSELQTKAQDLNEEVSNLHQQADATARVVRSLDVQLETITTEVDGTTSSLLRAEDELAMKKAVLRRRLIDIYKRGPMHTTEALLAARTFGQLLGRYKYLHELARRDQSLVTRVEDLYDQVAKQRQQLVRLRDEFERSRQEKRDDDRLSCQANHHTPAGARRGFGAVGHRPEYSELKVLSQRWLCWQIAVHVDCDALRFNNEGCLKEGTYST